jgi:hypothetical protein
MSDDQLIMIVLGIGVVVIAIIVVVGVLTSRRKRRSGLPSYTVSLQYLGEQPFLVSSDVEIGDKRSWEQFVEQYPIGAVVPNVTVVNGQDEASRTLHISAVKRSLRAGWPTAKARLTAYFAEFEHSELPASFPAKGKNRIVSVNLDRAGFTAVNAAGEPIWSSSWPSLRFSNGRDLLLRNSETALRIEYLSDGRSRGLEELVIKYGTLQQMHF